MNSLIFGICISALLSATSLLIVLLRVSPLTAPRYAIPAFFISTFFTACTIGTLCFMLLWKYVSHDRWDTGKLTSISLRQGIFLGIGTAIALLFHLLGLLNWWITILIYSVFVLLEMALEH